MPGFSAECVSGQHTGCVERECRCQCHRDRNLAIQTAPAAAEASLTTKLCPQCGVRTPMHENFCRRDGSPLVAGTPCRRCARPVLPSDNFCSMCGLATKAEEPPPEKVKVSLTDERIAQLKEELRARVKEVV